MHASDNLYKRMYKDNQMDQEFDHKVKKVSDKFSETVNMIANEPSLAFFRIQEHVRKTLPQLVDTKHEVEGLQSKVQGSCFDTDYAINAVKAMQSSAIHFENIQDLLKNAMYMKQQISYEENKRKQERSSSIVGAASNDSNTKPLSQNPGTSDGSQTDGKNLPPSSSSYFESEGLGGSDESAESKEVQALTAQMKKETES